MMDDAGFVKVEWDKDFNPIRVVKVSGALAGYGGTSGELQVGENEDQEEFCLKNS